MLLRAIVAMVAGTCLAGGRRFAVHPPSAPPHDPTRLASGPARETREPGVPYPLIALAALSLVLLASGIAAGLAHRRR